MLTVTLARHAMATRFELVLHGPSELALRAAGEEALDEIARLEDELSYFRATSQIFRLNREAAHGPVRVTPAVFRLLQTAQQLSRASGGTFDITVAPLMRCWGFYTREGRVPEPAALAEARACVGMELVELNAADHTVRFSRPGVELDLGSIGKGYAVERAGELLREAGVTSALLHGGTSTVLALGAPPEADGWKIALAHPLKSALASDEVAGASSETTSPWAAASPAPSCTASSRGARRHGNSRTPRDRGPPRHRSAGSLRASRSWPDGRTPRAAGRPGSPA